MRCENGCAGGSDGRRPTEGSVRVGVGSVQFLLDTNIVIAYLAGDPTLAKFRDGLALGRFSPLVSVVTEYEFLRYPKITDREELGIADFLSTVRVVAVERRTAQIAALLSRQYRMDTADALIAATAIEWGAPLLTRNVRDFRRITELNLLTEPPSLTEEQ